MKNVSPQSLALVPSLTFLLKWTLLSLLVGALAGASSAFFLWSLKEATEWRNAHRWIVWFLPFGGLIIGLAYHYLGTSVVRGNNQLLDEFHKPEKIIPFKMAPLVLFGTIATHFFGGSAGREGTAVQIGGAIADQFTRLFKFKHRDRRILLLMGVSAGFASVFGTPLAGTIFALEVFIVGRMRYEALIPTLITAVFAHYCCHELLQLVHVHHTQYLVSEVPKLSISAVLWSLLAGLVFGLGGRLFSQATHFWGNFFKKYIAYPPLRPVIGGLALALVVWIMGTHRYIGLGVPVIEASFQEYGYFYDFILKVLFTSFTLGAGFKGGEVTPLFFVGATLGNTLSLFVPLPMALMAGMGFVAVFSGATNTPIACTVMGIELFGIECGVFIAIACFVAYLFSGHTGIYQSQIVGSPKHLLFGRIKGRKLGDLKK